jgi:hypothetical protein
MLTLPFKFRDITTIGKTSCPEIVLNSCGYCHNYERSGPNAVIFFPKFAKEIRQFPVFAKEDVQALGLYLKQRLASGNLCANAPVVDGSYKKPSPSFTQLQNLNYSSR